ncbi:MAG: hypothetical protein HYU70_13190 [Bacteroidetes bacterium]|nr:hypothetical protein [Bacteroidota bacterium]
MFTQYQYKSQTVFYNGNVLDSLLEFRYILMIEETHAWLRQGFEMYYNLEKLIPGMKEDLLCYRPDFLIRNWQTGKAKLIELKPAGFVDDHKKRKIHITSRYIDEFQYDWTYRYLSDAHIQLSDDQQRKFYSVLREQDSWQHKPCGRLLQNITPLNDNEYRQFVMNGWLPATAPRICIVASHSCTSFSLLPATH